MVERKMKLPLLVCPHCGNKIPHQVVFTHSYVGDWYGSDGEPSEDPPESYYTGYACSTCGDLSIYETHEYDEGGRGTLAFPANVDLAKSIPELVAANYRESKRVQKVSPNAFAVDLSPEN